MVSGPQVNTPRLMRVRAWNTATAGQAQREGPSSRGFHGPTGGLTGGAAAEGDEH